MSRHSSTHIPYDVWEHIASFLPERRVMKLYTVNSALFHIAMNARYKHVELSAFDERKMRLLRRLQYVPDLLQATFVLI